jgi:ribosomal protein S18 acetylase RimI-like enzyme
MIVRKAEAADADAIARIYVESWRDSYAGLVPDHVLTGMSRRRQAADWRGVIAHGRHAQRVRVAEGTAGILGFGSTGPARYSGLPYQGEVYTLYVDPGRRGEGIGRTLLEALFGALAEDRMGSALLWVLAENPARYFYEAVGGRFVAWRDERLWGTVLRQRAYGWLDVTAATRPSALGKGQQG